ncbi:hypothetical protein [Parvularcula maris]|uniref:Uncharacterized protein n=1 Tax=Parvularcula maris TaxID=2965077 RepID=A0A9X2RIZ4_9PROT|nr:hypothetical protein [Parvularcula maris]MCQ8184128.1 hypothetical protein [Parvularcula maris]
MGKDSRGTNDALIVGGAAGTGITAILVQIPDGITKTILLLITPPVSQLLGLAWSYLKIRFGNWLADQTIEGEKKRARKSVSTLRENSADPDTIAEAESKLNGLELLTIDHSADRIKALSRT